MVLADTDNEALIEVLIGDHIAENEDRDGNEHADEVENQLPIEQPKKQKFKNLDEDKYCDLLAQRKRFCKYTDAKKPIKIKWWTVPRESLLQPRGAKNIMRNRHAPEGLTKRLKTSLELFKLFFTDEMLEKIILYTNNSIKPSLEQFSTL